MATRINYRDVLDFFEESTPEMGELVLSLVEDKMTLRAERKAELSARLKKARAAKGKGHKHAVNALQAGQEVTGIGTEAPIETAAPAPRKVGRPRHVETEVNGNTVGGQAISA